MRAEEFDTCDPEGGGGERLVGRGVRESSSCPSDVTTRRGGVPPPTRTDSELPRRSRTLAEGFRGRTTSGAEPPPRPGMVGRTRGSRGKNWPLESRQTPGPRLPHRFRRRARPGPSARRLLEPPPARRGETCRPCPPGRACSRDSPLPDIDVP